PAPGPRPVPGRGPRRDRGGSRRTDDRSGLMDEDLIRRIEAQLVEESERRSPPAEWPVLSDLPVGRYTDEELCRLESDRLFGRTWVYAGHESELPEPGSYLIFDRTGSPILIVR